VDFYLGYNTDYKTKFQTVFIKILAIFIAKVVVLCSFDNGKIMTHVHEKEEHMAP